MILCLSKAATLDVNLTSRHSRHLVAMVVKSLVLKKTLNDWGRGTRRPTSVGHYNFPVSPHITHLSPGHLFFLRSFWICAGMRKGHEETHTLRDSRPCTLTFRKGSKFSCHLQRTGEKELWQDLARGDLCDFSSKLDG